MTVIKPVFRQISIFFIVYIKPFLPSHKIKSISLASGYCKGICSLELSQSELFKKKLIDEILILGRV